MNIERMAAIAAFMIATASFAHEGHDHGFPGGGAAMTTGPVTLSALQIETLGIETQEAIFGELRQTLSLPGVVELPPERRASVSPMAAGQVTRLFVVPGQAVKRGEPIAQIEPVAVGARSFTMAAPIEGIVEALVANLGETLEAGGAVATIVDPSRVLVRGAAMESPALGLLKNGLDAEFIPDAARERRFAGAVERLLLFRKPGDATFGITAGFENAEGTLVPGMTGRLNIAIGEAAPAVLVPARAVLGEIADRFVFVRNGETFERRAIVLGQTAGEMVEAIDGVLPGDLIVTQGHYQLQFAGATAAAAGEHEHDHDH